MRVKNAARIALVRLNIPNKVFMNRTLRAAAGLLVWAAVCFPTPVAGQTVPSIRRVQVLRTRGQVEIEIEASDRVIPHTNVLTGPDRLIVDFVNAVPGESTARFVPRLAWENIL